MPVKNNCSYWGIFKGFSAIQQRIENWKTPSCPKCKKELAPWIDWVYHGSVGYCDECQEMYAVRYSSKPSSNYHPRFEIEELEEHHYHRIEFDTAWISPKQLWKFYENIPINFNDIEFFNYEREKLNSCTGLENNLVEHLLWRLIFNSEYFDKTLFYQYLEFCLKFPHFYKIYNEYEIWLGYEIDLVNNIEKSNKEQIYDTLYEVYKQYKDVYKISQFRTSIGIFVLLDYLNYKRYEPEFDEFLSKIIIRIF
ncbi:MAG: hypothetical protein PHW83_07395 [Bacteroidales bacterium]|nr:hypothetical protein [Bacteroidales bacterium]